MFNKVTPDLQLKEREELFRATFEQAAVGIAHISPSGQWLRVNQRLCSIVGYSESALRTKTFEEITHPDDVDIDLAYVAQMLSGQRQRYAMEKRYLHSAGKIVWVNLTVSLVRSPAGEPKYFISMVEDISDRKQAEADLLASEQRFRNAINSAPFPAIICAEDGEILHISEGWTRLSGYQHSDMPILSDWAEKAYGDRKMDILQGINRLFALNKTVDEGEFSIRTKTGEYSIWQFSTSPLGQLADGRRLIIAMAADVTAVKESEQQIRQLNQVLESRVRQRTAQLETANEELKAFTYTVSHDLRAPLRAMQGFAQALLEDYAAQLDDLGTEYAERIVKAAASMDGLILDLLKYSRLNRTEIYQQPLRLDQVLAEVVSDLASLIEESGATITIAPYSAAVSPATVSSATVSSATVSSATVSPAIYGNHQIVAQILTNLLTNSIKFVAADVQPDISVSYEDNGDYIRLWMTDNGIGIANEHQHRIFDVFQRLHGVESYAGSGIGLAIVKRGAEQLGGKAGVESAVGRGSRFWVDFLKVSPKPCDQADELARSAG